MVDNVSTFFVSEKISAIRWCLTKYGKGKEFITGSWHGSVNFVKLWRLEKSFKGYDEYSSVTPKCTASISFNCDISGLEILKSESMVISTSGGYIAVIKNENSFAIHGTSTVLHTFNSGKAAPCTGISIFEKDIATVGEDGALKIIDSLNLRCVKSVTAGSCALTTVCFVGPQEVLTANRMGVIKMFDLRLPDNESTASFLISSKDDRKSNYTSCITCHPTQRHIVLTGSEEGSLTVWDLRQVGVPASYLSSHTSSITSVRFHQTEPSKLFTSSENGELWQWSQTSNISKGMEPNAPVINENTNPWLDAKRTKGQINVTALISDHRKAINSFDSYGSEIICGGDCEAIYLAELREI